MGRKNKYADPKERKKALRAGPKRRWARMTDEEKAQVLNALHAARWPKPDADSVGGPVPAFTPEQAAAELRKIHEVRNGEDAAE